MASLATRWLQEGRYEGIKEGEKEKARVIARNLIKAGVAVDLISEATGLSIAEIQNLN